MTHPTDTGLTVRPRRRTPPILPLAVLAAALRVQEEIDDCVDEGFNRDDIEDPDDVAGAIDKAIERYETRRLTIEHSFDIKIHPWVQKTQKQLREMMLAALKDGQIADYYDDITRCSVFLKDRTCFSFFTSGVH